MSQSTIFSHVGTCSWVEPVLNSDDVSCSRIQHNASCVSQARDLFSLDVKSSTLPLSTGLDKQTFSA